MVDFPSGDGSEGDPYGITHLEHLDEIRNNLDKFFILLNNIDFDDDTSYLNTDNKTTWTTGTGWTPIGNSENRFTGAFNGQNHIINNLFIDRDDTNHIGLFGYADSASISNLGLININSTGYDYVGGLLGVGSSVTVEKCYTKGNVSGRNYIAGMIADTVCTINNSYSIVNVSGTNPVAGFIGKSAASSISNSYSAGSVTGTGGGFIAVDLFSSSTITNCFWDTETSGKETSDGGTGKTTAEMKSLSTFTGWDIGGSINDLNNRYPYLSWQNDISEPTWLILDAIAMIITGNATIQT